MPPTYAVILAGGSGRRFWPLSRDSRPKQLLNLFGNNTLLEQALERLDGLLSQAERELVRRGRNRAGRGPRHGDPAAYGLATGFEALLGWLFLHDPPRLVELLDHLEENDP